MSQIPNNIQLTREELDKRLGKFMVDDEFTTQLFDPAVPLGQRKQLLQRMLDGSAQYAVAASKILFDHGMSEHQQEFAGVKEIANKLYRSHMFAELYGKNPTLKEYNKLVEDAVAALSARDDLPSEDEKLIEAIAVEAEARIKQVKPEFSRVPASVPGQQPNQQSAQAHQQPTSGASAPAHVPANTDNGGFQGGTARSGSSGGGAAMKSGAADDIWND